MPESINPQELRIEGIYQQRQENCFMQRIKLPGGVISAEQSIKVAEIADRYAQGKIHLTTRGSMELHWLSAADLPVVARQLAAVGLLGRGACGGAVRGVVCSTLSSAGAPRLEVMVRMIHRHFTGNPRFEKLPKKFKIAVEADISSGRHLIQDLALIPVDINAQQPAFDVWTAGGLGREPEPAFLLAGGVPQERILALIEAVIRLYVAHTPAGKRLKHLVREIGVEEFRARIMADPAAAEELPTVSGLSAFLVPVPTTPAHRLEVGVFAGELVGSELAALAEIALRWAGGILLVTCEQNIAFHLDGGADSGAVRPELVYAGFPGTGRRERASFRVCPGSHECRMGLAPTRDLAAELVDLLGPQGMKLGWALSGCPNCCAQPQLAEVGIAVSRLVNLEGERTPRFDLYRRTGAGLGEKVQEQLTFAELAEQVRQLG
jgi:sulfite reductase (ferredoxin)